MVELFARGFFVLMPILLLAYPDDSPDLLTAISLAVVFFNALSGSIAYGRMRRIDYKSGLLMAATALPGAVIGARRIGPRVNPCMAYPVQSSTSFRAEAPGGGSFRLTESRFQTSCRWYE